MAGLFSRLNSKKERDLRVLADFVSIFCRENHAEQTREEFLIRDDSLRRVLGHNVPVLCPDCARLLNHGTAKLLLCEYDPKPMCKNCETHCYAPGYREQIREVMKFAGLYLIKHGRVDLMAHYFL